MRKRLARWVSVALLVVVPLTTVGCFGSFQLLRRVYTFNRDISQDRWAQEGVFLLLNIPFVPIYGLSSAVDALFLNSVEFWTGERLLDGSTTRVEGERGEVAEAQWNTDGSVDLTITEPDGTVHFVHLVRDGEAMVAQDANGAELARVATVDGQPALIEPTQP